MATEETAVVPYRLIGAGPDNNLVVRQLLRVTFNANGVPTSYKSELVIDCH